MKEWVKNLDDKKIFDILSYKPLQRKVPDWMDVKIHERIRAKSAGKQNTQSRSFIVKGLLVAILAVLLIIPIFVIPGPFPGRKSLVIVEVMNDVTSRKNETSFSLSPGDLLEEHQVIFTGDRAQCRIHYTENKLLTIREKSRIKIHEYYKGRVTFRVMIGKIIVKEEPGTRNTLYIETPFARVNAIGTYYSVEHITTPDETIIKAFEGTLHIETIPGGEVHILEEGQEMRITKNDPPEIRKSLLSDKADTMAWTAQVLYSNPEIKEPITGFSTFTIIDEKIIATTRDSVVCLDSDGLIWENRPTRRFFHASPVIYNQTVYISTPDSMCGYDLFTGIKKSEIRLKEQLKAGRTLSAYNNLYYITFTSGIYEFTMDTGSTGSKPLIPVIDAAMPVFYNNTHYMYNRKSATADTVIYVTSQATNSIEAFDIAGENKWTVLLDAGSICSPVMSNNSIIAGTVKGTLYRISLDGIIEKQRSMHIKILAVLVNENGDIFIHTDNNTLILINPHTFEIVSIYRNVTTMLAVDNLVITGSPEETLKVIDLNTKTETIIQLPYSYTTSLGYMDGIIFTGMKNGSIVKVEKKQVY